jgi:hypothetical protein
MKDTEAQWERLEETRRAECDGLRKKDVAGIEGIESKVRQPLSLSST